MFEFRHYYFILFNLFHFVLFFSLNGDSRLQIVLWEPNKNLASKIVSDIFKENKKNTNIDEENNKEDNDFIDADNSCSSNNSSSSSLNNKYQVTTTSDYEVEEPIDPNSKRSLKRFVAIFVKFCFHY